MSSKIIPNPYIAGNPVHGDSGFFGRADIMRQVEQILAAPGQNAVVLFGQRRIGKTSILLQLQHNLPSDQYTVIYQDLQDKASQPMGKLLAELAGEIRFDLDLAGQKLTFDDQGRVFQQKFLPQVYQSLSDNEQRLVLLFDEFDVLDAIQRERLPANSAANQLFPTLRRWMREEPRLAFVFALGRNLDDLDSDFLSTFRGSQTIQISIFSKEETIGLITAPNNLHYIDEAINRIYTLTNGHPYFTQLLCSLCFDRAYDRLAESAPQPAPVTVKDVEALIPVLLNRGDNVFAWIWDGLPSVERIVISTLAELLTDDKTVAAKAEIEEVLQHRAIRAIARDLQMSPKKLINWGLLQKEHGGYRFLIPVLHRWIRENKPLATTRDEIDRRDPRAERYYQVAKAEYQANELQEAEASLQKALRLNPDHLQARILLGDVKLEQQQFDEATDNYEKIYRQDKNQVREKLIDALHQKAEQLIAQEREQEAQNLYRRIRQIDFPIELEPPYGTMPPDSKFYIKRAADNYCWELIKATEAVTLFIQSSRQMGKSSLMHRILVRAKKTIDKRFVFIDFQRFPEQYFMDEKSFLIDLCLMIGDALGIPEAIDRYWQKRRTNIVKCSHYLSEYVIPQLNEPFILAMDEVERMLISPFRTNFFGMLRTWHNSRAYNKNFAELTLFLSSSTEPYLFINNPSQSPFNVAEIITLQDFTTKEVAELNRRHYSPLTPAQVNDLMALIGGHPYLVRLSLYLTATQRYSVEALFTQATEDSGPFGEHLLFYLRRVLKRPELKEAITYICRHHTYEENQLYHSLIGAGLVKRDGQKVFLRNQLYARYFEKHLNI